MWVYVLPVCSCPRPAEILSHAVFLFLSEVCYTSLLPFAPSLPLYLSILSLCHCGRADCCSVTSTALAFQQRRIRWQFHIPLSLSLSLWDVTRSVHLYLTLLIFFLPLFLHLSISFCLSLCFSALSHISCLNWKGKVLQSDDLYEWEPIDTLQYFFSFFSINSIYI